MDNQCGVDTTIRIIGRKWTILILYNLLNSPRRFGELQKTLKGISPKTLSLRLTELESDGLISKKIYAEVPPRVEYTLTHKGETLNEIICKMREWGECKETISH